MNTSAEVVLNWADGAYIFALKAKQIEELQRVCGTANNQSGIGEIAARVFAGRMTIQDIYHTIRLGLIGGGMAPVTAMQKVDAYILPLADPSDPSSPWQTAKAVLSAAYFGVEEIKQPGEPVTATTEEALSTSRSSEQPASRSDGAPLN
jgi:hypothetical protein